MSDAYLDMLVNNQQQITILLDMVKGLANRVEALEGMMEQAEDEEPVTYMDGSPVR